MLKQLMVNVTLLFLLLCRASCPSVSGAEPDTVYVRDATGLIREQYRPLARYLTFVPASIPTVGNEMEIITNGLHYRELLTADYKAAKDYIELETMLFASDTTGHFFKELLLQKAGEGVTVRYTHDNVANLFDNIIDGRSFFNGFYSDMRKRGVDMRNFRPLGRFCDGLYPITSWNHRKISIVDGKVAYVGGMNINDGSMGAWEDTHIRIKGPAVMSLRAMFLQNWNMLSTSKSGKIPLQLVRSDEAASGEGAVFQLFADGPDVPANSVQDALVWTLENASRYVYIATPYFMPTKRVVKAMKKAAERGLDVRLLIARDADVEFASPVNHSYYKTCVRSGVRIFERVDRFVHSKVFIADDYMLYIGSSNLDKQSLLKLYEAGAMIYDEHTATLNARKYLEDLKGTEEVTETTFAGWSAGERFKQKVFRPLSFWM